MYVVMDHGAERSSQYVYGKIVNVMTDHKPLLNCLKKPINTAPVRIPATTAKIQLKAARIPATT